MPQCKKRRMCIKPFRTIIKNKLAPQNSACTPAAIQKDVPILKLYHIPGMSVSGNSITKTNKHFGRKPYFFCHNIKKFRIPLTNSDSFCKSLFTFIHFKACIIGYIERKPVKNGTGFFYVCFKAFTDYAGNSFRGLFIFCKSSDTLIKF